MKSAEERQELAVAIFERTGLKIDQDDPVFVLVELNRMVLQEESKRAAAAVTAASESAQASMLAAADSWAAQCNEVLARFALKTQELREALDKPADSAPPAISKPHASTASPGLQAPRQNGTSQNLVGFTIVIASVVLVALFAGFGLASFLTSSP